jgi:hypothetical protein
VGVLGNGASRIAAGAAEAASRSVAYGPTIAKASPTQKEFDHRRSHSPNRRHGHRACCRMRRRRSCPCRGHDVPHRLPEGRRQPGPAQGARNHRGGVEAARLVGTWAEFPAGPQLLELCCYSTRGLAARRIDPHEMHGLLIGIWQTHRFTINLITRDITEAVSLAWLSPGGLCRCRGQSSGKNVGDLPASPVRTPHAR